jgi:diguanylate cyclase (GGDEF)-like protein
MEPRGQTLDVSPRWDKRTGRLTNRSREHEWLASIHPDDVQRAVRTIAQARREKSLIDVEYRAADNAGGWRWKRSRGSPRFDRAGNVVCWYGSIQDIAGPTEPPSKARAPEAIAAMAPEAQGETCLKADTLTPEQRREQAIRRNHALLELEILDTPAEAEFDDLVLLASELCQTPISLVSLVTSERQWFKAAIGISASETPIEASFCAHAIRQPGLLVVEDALTDERFRDNPLVLGDPHIRFYAGMPVCAGNEVPVGTLCVIDTVPRSLSAEQAKALTILGQQVQTRLQLRSERIKLLRAVADNQMLSRQLEATNAALSEANERLQHLASTDMLTGLVNRRAFEEKLSDGFQKAQTNRRPLALLVVYLDDLEKRIDEFGHAAGNETLRSIGEVLRKSVRGGQIAARIGGEEFAVLLPEMTRLQAANLARRVQETLKRVRVDLSPVSVSVGCVWLDESYTSWQAFLDDAHREMLKAKRAAHEKMAVLEGRFVA